ncbi:MAG: twin-arginine translocase subunit TatC, partial [Chloroflexota bacterium]|nr:twin-arginine translocase subunit TatC [Chloroflexota bacterium]
MPRTDEPYEDIFEEMSLQEHLEELRSRVVKTCLSIGVAFIAAIFLTRPLLKFIRDKAQADQGIDILSPTDPITVFMKVALYIAIGFALPIIIWQLVGFLAPGLTRREKRYLFMSLPFVSLLFVAGAAFGSLLAAPRAFKFLSGFMSDIFQWSPNGMEIISFYITLMIGMG